MRELDAQPVGLFVTSEAISEVTAKEFTDFMENHVAAFERHRSNPHPQLQSQRP
ncbi:hypothetical protein [Parasedimentitalea denitrificans]|uniref:hypothetical protein n=1 Tax=Parasedimentitalea denitrificans TaxID=2211118 RepID=UPI00197EE143|nr:hypothetical protein [Sedimentitalea sp. CY04]